MFQFSSLQTKIDAANRPADEPQTDRSSATFPHPPGETEQPAQTASTCVSERVRRDLDEQMSRLAELLERVESLEFGQETDDLSIAPADSTKEPEPQLHGFPPFEDAPLAGRINEVAPSISPPEISCQVVLSCGVFTHLADLPRSPLQPGRQAENLAESDPDTLPWQTTSKSQGEPSTAAGEAATTAPLTPGMIQDIHLIFQPVADIDSHKPELLNRSPKSSPTSLEDDPLAGIREADYKVQSVPVGSEEPDRFESDPAATPSGGDTPLPNILAALGGLLTLAALSYIAADVAGWF